MMTKNPYAVKAWKKIPHILQQKKLLIKTGFS
jgi:hypothetical protein